MNSVFRRRFIGSDFLLLWFAQAGSSFGEFLFAATATVWVATGLFPHSAHLPTFMALIVLSATVPRIVVAPIAGVLVDRWNVRYTMVVSDAARVLCYTVLLIVVEWESGSDAVRYWAALIVLTSGNVSAQFFNPARAALMQVVIPEERRVEAASTSMFALTGVAMAATALGPISYAVLGVAASISVCIGAYGLSLLMTCLTENRSVRADDPPGHFWSEFVGGFRTAWASAPLRMVLIGVLLYGFSLGINNTALSLYGLKTLHLEPKQYGLLSMMFPAGNLVASISGVRLVKRYGQHRVYVLSLIGLGVGYGVYGLVRSVPVAFVTMFGCGLVFSLYVLCQGPILQEATPAGYMGRITAISTPAMALASAVGTVAVSQLLGLLISPGSGSSRAVADPYGTMIAVGAGIMLVGGVVMFAAQRKRPPDSDPAERSATATSTSG
ncbi:MFS transporter [Nocardia miyunensis]|uniref:MFS transporter n=1 Tax=Nocardia miyunensis TaxID=282684 RepID=UPI0008295073|nr:MFS transporter [Nocardia miyunensis]